MYMQEQATCTLRYLILFVYQANG